MSKSFYLFGLLTLALVTTGAYFAVTGKSHPVNIAQVIVPPEVTLLAGGDVNLGRQTGKKILAGEVDYPFEKIADTLKDADITFVNLESQLADLNGETQSPTSEYRFAGPPEGGKTLANAGIDIVSVANNHMWDYGLDRLIETLTALKNNGVVYVGSSLQPGEQFKPVIVTVKTRKIAFFALTNLLNGYEKTAAPKYISYQSQDELAKQIAAVKDTVDWVVVSMHGGVEYAASPAAGEIETAHALVDAGADVILGHHPHVVQPIEIYNGKPIFYSLGNFAFWQPFSFWTQHSFLAKLTLKEPHKVEYKIIPVKAGWQPELLTDPKDQAQLQTRLDAKI